MKSAYFLFSLLFLQTNSFSINRRSALASMISMTALNPPDSNEDDTSKHLKLVEQNNLPMNIFLGGEQTDELGILQDENNEIYFYGPVSQRSCFELKNKLNSLDAKSSIFHMQYKILCRKMPFLQK